MTRGARRVEGREATGRSYDGRGSRSRRGPNPEPSQIALHLAFVARLKRIKLEIHGHEPAHPPVKEQQVEVKVLAVDGDALLTLEARERYTQLENEAPHLSENRRLEILLGVQVLQAEEIEKVRIAEYQVRRQPVLSPQRCELPTNQRVGLLRERAALEQHGPDSRRQGTRVPALDAAQLGVEIGRA